MSFNPDDKKHTLRLLHHNVAVVSAGKNEEAVGATVTWFMQSSFDPPLVTLAVKADSRLNEAIRAGRNLVISLVAKDDKDLAAKFFKPGSWDGDQFGGFDASAHPLGGAILDASPAWLVCELREVVEQGDHHIVVSEVVDCGVNDEKVAAMCLSETGWHYGG